MVADRRRIQYTLIETYTLGSRQIVTAPGNPVLSVVVAIVCDTVGRPDVSHLEPCLAALTRRSGAPTMEIIVPFLPSVPGIAQLRARYPDVRFFEVPDLRTYTGAGESREHRSEEHTS